jgi:hypothetical protein
MKRRVYVAPVQDYPLSSLSRSEGALVGACTLADSEQPCGIEKTSCQHYNVATGHKIVGRGWGHACSIRQIAQVPKKKPSEITPTPSERGTFLSHLQPHLALGQQHPALLWRCIVFVGLLPQSLQCRRVRMCSLLGWCSVSSHTVTCHLPFYAAGGAEAEAGSGVIPDVLFLHNHNCQLGCRHM